MTKFEQKWWGVALLAGFSAVFARYLLDMAGIGSPSGVAQWLVCWFCMMVIWRILAGLASFILVLAAPRSKLVD